MPFSIQNESKSGDYVNANPIRIALPECHLIFKMNQNLETPLTQNLMPLNVQNESKSGDCVNGLRKSNANCPTGMPFTFQNESKSGDYINAKSTGMPFHIQMPFRIQKLETIDANPMEIAS